MPAQTLASGGKRYGGYLEESDVPSIQMKYINIKGNMNNDLKKIYMSMSDILFENRRVFN